MILDLVMPDLDGMAVLTRLRDSDRKVPTIVQTANGSIEAVISAMRAGAVDFVVKAGRGRTASGFDQERLARRCA